MSAAETATAADKGLLVWKSVGLVLDQDANGREDLAIQMK